MTESHESARKVFHINSISFNSDRSFFTVSMDEGLRLYKTDPLELYEFLDSSIIGSVLVSEQLDSSSTFLLTGGGRRPVYPGNRCMYYNFDIDNDKGYMKLPTTILNVLIRDEITVLVAERFIQVYDVKIHPLHGIEYGPIYNTGPNPLGLCQMARDHAKHHVMCFPGTAPGCVQIVNIASTGVEHGHRCVMKAHESALACIRLSQDGSLLATASTKGTLIRVWCTETQNKVVEFRRGMDHAIIYDIDISADNQFLACVGDKGTVHIFAVERLELNTISNLSGIGPRRSYTESVWKMAKYSIHGIVDCKIALLGDQSVVVATKDGRYFKHQFVPGSPSDCRRTSFEIYTDLVYDHGTDGGHETTGDDDSDSGDEELEQSLHDEDVLVDCVLEKHVDQTEQFVLEDESEIENLGDRFTKLVNTGEDLEEDY